MHTKPHLHALNLTFPQLSVATLTIKCLAESDQGVIRQIANVDIAIQTNKYGEYRGTVIVPWQHYCVRVQKSVS